MLIILSNITFRQKLIRKTENTIIRSLIRAIMHNYYSKTMLLPKNVLGLSRSAVH